MTIRSSIVLHISCIQLMKCGRQESKKNHNNLSNECQIFVVVQSKLFSTIDCRNSCVDAVKNDKPVECRAAYLMHKIGGTWTSRIENQQAQ